MNYSSIDSTNNETDPGQNRNIVTTGDWVLSILLLAIPIVNIVAPFVWTFSRSTPLSKKNFGKAIIILWLVPIVLIVVFWGSFMAMFGTMSSGKLI